MGYVFCCFEAFITHIIEKERGIITMESSIGFLLLIQVILIALNAVFASAEIAVISISDIRLAKLAEKGDKRAVRLVRLTSQPARFLATIQVAITLSGFLGSAFAADNFSGMLVDWLIGHGVPVPRSVLETISVVLITLILSYFTLIFGELVPKRVAMRKAESLALAISGLICTISTLFAPIVWFLTASTNTVLRLLGIDPNEEEENVSEEEIRMMLDAGSEKGTIDPEEKKLIQNVFEFDDLTAGEIIVHRTDMDLLWMEDSPEQWDTAIREGIHTLYPVCDQTADNVIGILNSKHYFRLNSHDRDTVMEKAVKPAYFVPETVKADVLFRNMKQTHNFFAVVLDEYGGVSGIITMNDLLEQIVGDFEPEEQEESEQPDIEQITLNGSTAWNIRGGASLKEVAAALNVTFPDDDCDTFGGYVFGVIGAVPDDGSRFELRSDGLLIRLEEVEDHQLVRAVVSRLPDDAEESSK